MEKISVIMSVFNETKEQLINSIESILKQTFIDFELIIILDNPNNIIAKNILIEYTKLDNRFLFLENDKNYGLPYSLNKAIKISKGKYIARMDSDDISNLDRFEKQFNYLEENKDIDLLFTGWTEIDEKGNKLVRIPKKEWFINIKKYFFTKSMILHPTLMCKSEILKKNNYPITERPEDFILFLDLIKIGYIFDVLEESLFLYTTQNYDLTTKFKKINTYSKVFLPLLFKNKYYYANIYFWYFVHRVFIEYLLSRNYIIFKIFYMHLFKIIKNISI